MYAGEVLLADGPRLRINVKRSTSPRRHDHVSVLLHDSGADVIVFQLDELNVPEIGRDVIDTATIRADYQIALFILRNARAGNCWESIIAGEGDVGQVISPVTPDARVSRAQPYIAGRIQRHAVDLPDFQTLGIIRNYGVEPSLLRDLIIGIPEAEAIRGEPITIVLIPQHFNGVPERHVHHGRFPDLLFDVEYPHLVGLRGDQQFVVADRQQVPYETASICRRIALHDQFARRIIDVILVEGAYPVPAIFIHIHRFDVSLLRTLVDFRVATERMRFRVIEEYALGGHCETSPIVRHIETLRLLRFARHEDVGDTVYQGIPLLIVLFQQTMIASEEKIIIIPQMTNEDILPTQCRVIFFLMVLERLPVETVEAEVRGEP